MGDSIEKAVAGKKGVTEIEYVKAYNKNEYHRKNGLWCHSCPWQPWVTLNEIDLNKGFCEKNNPNPVLKPMVMYVQRFPFTYHFGSGKGKLEWEERYRNKTSCAWPVSGGINIF